MCNFNIYDVKGDCLFGLFLVKKWFYEFVVGNGFKIISLKINWNFK